MAEIQIDADVIENALQEILRQKLGPSVVVSVEREVGAFQPGSEVIIYLDRFLVKSERQRIAAGLRQDEDLSLTVWCFHTGLLVNDEVRRERNRIHRLCKRAILENKTLGGTVDTTFILGGEYQTLPREQGFTLGASIELTCEARMTIE